ncbi:thioesterase family protein [Pedobacter sp. JY14-1]|uniref:acyl-CoA thioesterase n=1 Tax=Pedobacter sp. JY14-1 TaxID=3034151 RepID=UPI0023E0FCC0|nr:thioesterase family protein [Pedobacter sp. JY14-1]
MYTHTTRIRVRYGETDQMGYVYYGNYAEYYEVGRVEMLRSLGMDYAGMERDGVMLPVLELNCKFIKPALYDQEITIVTTVNELPGVRIHFEYELFNNAGDLINTGNTTLVFIDMAKNRPCPAPAEFMERLRAHF